MIVKLLYKKLHVLVDNLFLNVYFKITLQQKRITFIHMNKFKDSKKEILKI